MTDRPTSAETESRQEEAEIIQDISFTAPHPTHSLFAMRTKVSGLPHFLPMYQVIKTEQQS